MTDDELNHQASPMIARYRHLKAKYDNIKSQMDDLRLGIADAIGELGSYQDDVGYAEFRTRRASVSYHSQNVDKLAQVWAESDDPVMKQCGQLLMKERKEKPSSEILYIK